RIVLLNGPRSAIWNMIPLEQLQNWFPVFHRRSHRLFSIESDSFPCTRTREMVEKQVSFPEDNLVSLNHYGPLQSVSCLREAGMNLHSRPSGLLTPVISRLSAAVDELDRKAAPLGLPPVIDREWYELLHRKLLPQLGASPFLIVAVVGGTNIGKSVI